VISSHVYSHILRNLSLSPRLTSSFNQCCSDVCDSECGSVRGDDVPADDGIDIDCRITTRSRLSVQMSGCEQRLRECTHPKLINPNTTETSENTACQSHEPQHHLCLCPGATLCLCPGATLTVILGHHCLFRHGTQLNLDIHRPQTLGRDVDIM
jgi:hypothetical protein